MQRSGLIVLLVLFLAACGESGNQAAGTAPGAGAPAALPQSGKEAKEQTAAPRQLPPSEPYGTTGN